VSEATNALPVRVFLVEDSPMIRDRLTESVSVPGRIEVVGHASGETTAIEALRDEAWDALVLDLKLAEGSGFGILRTLRREGRPVGTRIIVLTSYANSYYRAKSEEYGADLFLDKARDYQRVREVLEDMAEGRA
jgi:DNA-binding NarL/FixJ family response regulator